MARITDTMATDHRRCDEIFAEAEALVSDASWDDGGARFKEFHAAMEHHFSMEEEVLFPWILQMDEGTLEPEVLCGSINHPIGQMEFEHQAAGELRGRVAREARGSGGFALSGAATPA